MKNKLFLSLALLVAANAFIATPAMAYYTLTDAKRDALKMAKSKAAFATVKTAFGLAALSSSITVWLSAFNFSGRLIVMI